MSNISERIQVKEKSNFQKPKKYIYLYIDFNKFYQQTLVVPHKEDKKKSTSLQTKHH